MDEHYLQIFHAEHQLFRDSVRDSFGQKILQEVFVPSGECLGKFAELSENSQQVMTEIHSGLDALQAQDQEIEHGVESI